ncbi:sciellin isoform X12 [Syngnathus acus]|uniref:sciellin isoform X12 n=1 Tax=Syngnathus acus TaxID=161584 RepID=UPI0018860C93|nr:sciellin isoform X12 [Syngnathus acus]
MSTSRLKDDSWIRKDEDEYETVDRDPNFGSSLLSHYRSTDSLSGPMTESTQMTRSSSVQSLSKRFSGSQDELQPSSYSHSRLSYTQSSPSYRRSDEPGSRCTSTTTVSKDGTITETTITSQSLRSPTKTFSERVQTFSKGSEDKLYDTLIPSAIRDDDNRSSLSSSETMTLTRSMNGAGDELYGVAPLSSASSLRTTSRSYTDEIPSARVTSYSISSNQPNDDYSSTSGNYYYSSSSSSKPTYEYSSISSPTEYSSTTYRSSSTSRSDNMLSSPMTSSIKTVYTSPDRVTFERELCTYCHKPFNGDAKMILDEMKISCHAFCFKCEVCNGTLGHMKAGDCMWVYNHMVHCENCFDVTRDKWRH